MVLCTKIESLESGAWIRCGETGTGRPRALGSRSPLGTITPVQKQRELCKFRCGVTISGRCAVQLGRFQSQWFHEPFVQCWPFAFGHSGPLLCSRTWPKTCRKSCQMCEPLLQCENSTVCINFRVLLVVVSFQPNELMYPHQMWAHHSTYRCFLFIIRGDVSQKKVYLKVKHRDSFQFWVWEDMDRRKWLFTVCLLLNGTCRKINLLSACVCLIFVLASFVLNLLLYAPVKNLFWSLKGFKIWEVSWPGSGCRQHDWNTLFSALSTDWWEVLSRLVSTEFWKGDLKLYSDHRVTTHTPSKLLPNPTNANLHQQSIQQKDEFSAHRSLWQVFVSYRGFWRHGIFCDVESLQQIQGARPGTQSPLSSRFACPFSFALKEQHLVSCQIFEVNVGAYLFFPKHPTPQFWVSDSNPGSAGDSFFKMLCSLIWWRCGSISLKTQKSK